MRLNTIAPASGSKPAAKRVGRGEGSGIGKTCGRGQKGQKSRSGGFHKSGFEGGQMPLQRRLPKVGFRSRQTRFKDEIRLHELESLAGRGVTDIDMAALRAARMIDKLVKTVKVISSGELSSAVNVSGLKVTKGARAAIEAAGGKVA